MGMEVLMNTTIFNFTLVSHWLSTHLLLPSLLTRSQATTNDIMTRVCECGGCVCVFFGFCQEGNFFLVFFRLYLIMYFSCFLFRTKLLFGLSFIFTTIVYPLLCLVELLDKHFIWFPFSLLSCHTGCLLAWLVGWLFISICQPVSHPAIYDMLLHGKEASEKFVRISRLNVRVFFWFCVSFRISFWCVFAIYMFFHYYYFLLLSFISLLSFAWTSFLERILFRNCFPHGSYFPALFPGWFS